MKFGLVIQGPIISGGFTGRTHGFGKTRASSELLINFNCNNTIWQNIQNAETLFDEIVVSIWKNDSEKLNSPINSKHMVLRLDDPTPTPPRMRKPLPGFKDFGYINTIRQFYSVLEGLKYLKSQGVTHAVKLRTDQSLNIQLLFNELQLFATNSNNKFFVPFIASSTPWTIPDYYIAGEIEKFIELCEFMINPTFSFHENVHRDLFFKSYLLFTNKSRITELKNYFIYKDNPNLELSKMSAYALENIWAAGSQALFSSLVWRGEGINKNFTNMKFAEELKAGLKLEKIYNRDNVDWNQLLKISTGQKSLLVICMKVIYFRLKKIYYGFRSNISSIIDDLGLRKFFS
jgi:hypothetical protein